MPYCLNRLRRSVRILVRRELGKTAPCVTRRRTEKWHRYRDQIEKYMKENPDATLREIKNAASFSR